MADKTSRYEVRLTDKEFELLAKLAKSQHFAFRSQWIANKIRAEAKRLKIS